MIIGKGNRPVAVLAIAERIERKGAMVVVGREEAEKFLTASLIFRQSEIQKQMASDINATRLLIFGGHVLWSVRLQGSWELVGKRIDIHTPQCPVFEGSALGFAFLSVQVSL